MSPVDETVRAAIARARLAEELIPGEPAYGGKRWLCDVLRSLEQTEGSRGAALATLWAAVQRDEVELSRCDLRYLFPQQLVSESETVLARQTWHFARLKRRAG